MKVTDGWIYSHEAHRIRNQASKIHHVLKDLKSNHLLLIGSITISPSNLTEAWPLLNMCNPEIFNNEVQELFMEAVAKDPQLFPQVLKPFYLRRTKAQIS